MSVTRVNGAVSPVTGAGAPIVSPGPQGNLGRRLLLLEAEFFDSLAAGDLDNQMGMSGTSWNKLINGGQTDAINVDTTSKIDQANSATNIIGNRGGNMNEVKALATPGGAADEVIFTFKVLPQAIMLPAAGASVAAPFFFGTADIVYATNAAAQAGLNDVIDIGVGRTAGGNAALQFFDRETPAGTAFLDTGVALGTVFTVGVHIFPDHSYKAYVSAAGLTPDTLLTNPPAQFGPVGHHVDVNNTGHTAVVGYLIEQSTALVPLQLSNTIFWDTFAFYKVVTPALASTFFNGEVSSVVSLAGYKSLTIMAVGKAFDSTALITVWATEDGVNFSSIGTLAGPAVNVPPTPVRLNLAVNDGGIKLTFSIPKDTTGAGVAVTLVAQ